jgi:hypothetical protein
MLTAAMACRRDSVSCYIFESLEPEAASTPLHRTVQALKSLTTALS